MDNIEQNGDVLIAQFEKNKRDEIRFSVGTFHGRRIINIRAFYKDDEGNWRTGKQGLSIGIERFKDLASAVLEIGEYLKKNGLIQ